MNHATGNAHVANAPAKCAPKFRTLKPDQKPLLLRCNVDAGHGSSGRYDHFKEDAIVLAFMLDQMGITK
ncbi:MAG: hypothetical protein K8U57_37975 [Planctomycetes bacterium]|nr:hypothetical protein [Planctomycetota bacterium]